MGMMNRKQYAKWKPGDKVKPKLDCGDPLKDSLTKQEFGKESDINVIVGRYVRAGVPIMPDTQQVFADVSNFGQFGEVLQRIHAAEDAFAALPADVRSRFENDPAKLVEFVQDDANYDEAVKLGILEKREPPADKTLTTADKPAADLVSAKSAESQKPSGESQK